MTVIPSKRQSQIRSWHAQRLIVLTAIATLSTVVSGFAFAPELLFQNAAFLLPALATIVVFLVFSWILKRQVRENLLGELGFLYLVFVVAYTLFPAIAFIFEEFNPGFLWFLDTLGPVQSELSVHLWRHVLFLCGVAAGYLLVRGREPVRRIAIERIDRDHATITFLLLTTLVCVSLLSLLSAPVESYIDNYTRYDHLSWVPRKIVSICVRLKLGMYSLLIIFLFRNYQKYKLMIPFIVAIICGYELIYTLGARIESLMVLLMAIYSYNHYVKAITLGQGFIACAAFAVIFSIVEVLRALQFDMGSTKNAVLDAGLTPAFEFGAVYWTGLHLYVERAHGTLPATEWPMFFYDFISPFTLNEFTQWNPQYWYARNYFPEAIVPPATLGPIADSAVWGGEIDLLSRSLINGAFFGYVTRWFVRNRDKWWAIGIYVYFYATCVITLKYSVFYQLTPLLKTLLPSVFIVAAFRELVSSRRKIRPAPL